MMRAIFCFLVIVLISSIDISAQLSESRINEDAEQHIEMWTSYLGLSDYRKEKLRTIWITHKKNKGIVVSNSTDIKNDLETENQRFVKELSTILSKNELKFYQSVNEARLKDDQEYLATLLKSLSSDSLFTKAFTDFQYSEILPVKMNIRMELEVDITTEDKLALESIRKEIGNMYDYCLVTCLSEGQNDPTLFERFDNLTLDIMNEELTDSESSLSQLLELTKKYESEIQALDIKYADKYAFWKKKIKEMEEQYILQNHMESIDQIESDNEINILKQLESDAIFLLIDPFDQYKSGKFLNLGMYGRL